MRAEDSAILLVEDDENDVLFLKHAFESVGVLNRLEVAYNGQQAIDYLSGDGPYADRGRFPFPRLVLLDLNLPLREGLEVLRWIKQQPELQTLMVIMLSSSDDPKTVDECYRLGARSFLVKPVSIRERVEMAKAIKEYWLELNQFDSPR
jgi:CheY-like chemotaxis protein